MSYLVDSDWMIDALAGVQPALQLLEQLSEDGLAISIITVGEILEGAYGLPDPEAHRQRFNEFMAGFKTLLLDSMASSNVASAGRSASVSRMRSRVVCVGMSAFYRPLPYPLTAANAPPRGLPIRVVAASTVLVYE
ncbi:MAG: type II toxin-antitoxin system VapC family toxin [Chloroflexota bacterium]